MYKEEVKEILPILTAYVGGKVIQIHDSTGTWVDVGNGRINLYNLCNRPEGYRLGNHHALPHGGFCMLS